MTPADDAGALLRQVFADAVAAMDPAARVRAALRGTAWPRDVAVIAVGKAAVAMARGASEVPATRGLVVAPPGPDAVLPWPLVRASHPTPDASSEAAGRALLALAASLPPDGLLLALVSGGASALAAVPAPGLSLADKVAITRAVYASGAPIDELNTVRAALSAIKAGRLALACPAPVWTLVTSDVVGDDVAVVGSGPTVLREAHRKAHREAPIEAHIDAHREALIEVRAADILTARLGSVPAAAVPVLAAPAAPGHRGPRARDRVDCIAGVADLARAAASASPVPATVWSGDLAGDVADVARRTLAEIGAVGRASGPRLLVASGETTLALPPHPGLGGRARHLALLLARALAGRPGITCLVAGSDGVDGTGPGAGAVVDGTTWGRLTSAGVDGDAALAACDSGTALAAVGADVVTGPTGVNHADLLLVHVA